jgi:hypothetical protein
MPGTKHSGNRIMHTKKHPWIISIQGCCFARKRQPSQAI